MEVGSELRKEIEALLTKDEAALVRIAGAVRPKVQIRYEPPSLEVGKAPWWSPWRWIPKRKARERKPTPAAPPRFVFPPKVKNAICSSHKVREYAKHPDRVFLVAAVMDAVSGFVSGLTVAAVSVLVVKMGVEKMCAEDWCEVEKGTKPADE